MSVSIQKFTPRATNQSATVGSLESQKRSLHSCTRRQNAERKSTKKRHGAKTNELLNYQTTNRVDPRAALISDAVSSDTSLLLEGSETLFRLLLHLSCILCAKGYFHLGCLGCFLRKESPYHSSTWEALTSNASAPQSGMVCLIKSYIFILLFWYQCAKRRMHSICFWAMTSSTAKMIRDLSGCPSFSQSWEMLACLHTRLQLDGSRIIDGCSDRLDYLHLHLAWKAQSSILDFVRESLLDGLHHCVEEPDVCGFCLRFALLSPCRSLFLLGTACPSCVIRAAL